MSKTLVLSQISIIVSIFFFLEKVPIAKLENGIDGKLNTIDLEMSKHH